MHLHADVGHQLLHSFIQNQGPHHGAASVCAAAGGPRLQRLPRGRTGGELPPHAPLGAGMAEQRKARAAEGGHVRPSGSHPVGACWAGV